MSLRELTDVLIAVLFYDFLLSFMLTGCDGCIESDSKGGIYMRPGRTQTGVNSYRPPYISFYAFT